MSAAATWIAGGACAVAAWGTGALVVPFFAHGPAADRTRGARASVALRFAAVAVACAAGLAVRGLTLPQGLAWQPLESHADGLLLMGTFLAVAAAYLVAGPRLTVPAALVGVVLTAVLSWAVCATSFTDGRFQVDSLSPLWFTLHLGGVYVGTAAAAVAAGAGAAWLLAEFRLKNRGAGWVEGLGRFASLERLETLTRHAAVAGFVTLSIGLAAGVVITANQPGLVGSVLSPKLVLSVAAYAAFVVAVFFGTGLGFRSVGEPRRGAWGSIVGFVLLLVVSAVATAWPGGGMGGSDGVQVSANGAVR